MTYAQNERFIEESAKTHSPLSSSTQCIEQRCVETPEPSEEEPAPLPFDSIPSEHLLEPGIDKEGSVRVEEDHQVQGSSEEADFTGTPKSLDFGITDREEQQVVEIPPPPSFVNSTTNMEEDFCQPQPTEPIEENITTNEWCQTQLFSDYNLEVLENSAALPALEVEVTVEQIPEPTIETGDEFCISELTDITITEDRLGALENKMVEVSEEDAIIEDDMDMKEDEVHDEGEVEENEEEEEEEDEEEEEKEEEDDEEEEEEDSREEGNVEEEQSDACLYSFDGDGASEDEPEEMEIEDIDNDEREEGAIDWEKVKNADYKTLPWDLYREWRHCQMVKKREID